MNLVVIISYTIAICLYIDVDRPLKGLLSFAPLLDGAHRHSTHVVALASLDHPVLDAHHVTVY